MQEYIYLPKLHNVVQRIKLIFDFHFFGHCLHYKKANFPAVYTDYKLKKIVFQFFIYNKITFTKQL